MFNGDDFPTLGQANTVTTAQIKAAPQSTVSYTSTSTYSATYTSHTHQNQPAPAHHKQYRSYGGGLDIRGRKYKRGWLSIPPPVQCTGQQFSLLSYNLLADQYVDSTYTRHLSPHYVDTEYRL